MTLSCSILTSNLAGFSIIKECDVVKGGIVRIATKLQFPNGEYIDVFVKPHSDLGGDGFIVTDMGFTSDFLRNAWVSPFTNKKRMNYIEEVCALFDLKFEKGEIKTFARSEMELPLAIIDTAQSCLRVSDMVMNQRFKITSQFKAEFELFLLEDLKIAPGLIVNDYQITLPDRTVKIPFGVKSPSNFNLIHTLSCNNPTSAKQVSHEIFIDWYDLERDSGHGRFLTVYNSESSFLKEYDIKRLQDISNVVAFPADQEQIKELLLA
ncbi:DUF1828 domain-containing protein [Peredibacter starrii]|uniref:DUF1828 domain-containing protein n=1 Tax=Peredibacter starrii TaxID=28202 RepID=A0AAX4HSM2_9BACT|nr:DUF1828 domain-containing protein [Peredibacter starrii]WPU66272.1 DUF1828 domain-containing protein [Peredibacter starrii]